jgi:hypothetical protein
MKDTKIDKLLLGKSASPALALLTLAKHIGPFITELGRGRNSASLWPWNQLLPPLRKYLEETHDALGSHDVSTDDSGPMENEVLKWVDGGRGMEELAALNNFLETLQHVLGQTLNRKAEPFKGDAYEAIVEAGEKILSMVGDAEDESSFAEQYAQFFKSEWPDILRLLYAERVRSWAHVFTAGILSFEEGVLTLSFDSEEDALSFMGSAGSRDHLQSVILEFTGVAVTFRYSLKALPAEFATEEEPNTGRKQLNKNFDHRPRVIDSTGKLVDKSTDEDAWLRARKSGVTASDANRLIKLNGEKRTSFWSILETKEEDYVSPYFEGFALGIEREPEIARMIIQSFPDQRFVVNNWLFKNHEWESHLATPDLVGVDEICEIKVGSKALHQLESRYRDQMQWQMHVLGVERALFVVEQRVSRELETKWIARDQERITQLVSAANELLLKF